MRVTASLCLPKEARSVGAVRRVCRVALSEVGVAPEVAGDVELAVSEACTNAFEHTGPDGFTVDVEITEVSCTIEISDTGSGVEPVTSATSETLAERGRGIALMKSVMDHVDFTLAGETGTSVSLERRFV